MFCDQCGIDNPTQNKFCGQCGAKLDSANGKMHESLPAPVGPVSSEFRREVEQQQLRLKRLDDQPVKSYSELATSSLENEPNAELDDEPHADPIIDRSARDASYPNAITEEPETEYSGGDTISGPSFLGLSGADPSRPSDSRQDLSYLYEDDPNPGRARKVLALLIALAFLAFMAYEWRQNPNWQTTIVGKLRKAPAAPATSTPPPQQNAGTGQTPSTDSAAAATDQNREAATSQPTPGSQPANVPSQAPPADATPKAQDADKNVAATNPPPDHGAKATHPATDVAQGSDTNSTGEPGEQEAVDTDNPARSELVKNENAGANRTATARHAAASSPARSEQPDSELVTKADAYLYGRGVPKDCPQALVYLRTAANRGNAMARSKLGGLYATGHCVPLDRAEAYNWFTLSRDAGGNNVWVQRNREILWSKMTADEKARAMEPPR